MQDADSWKIDSLALRRNTHECLAHGSCDRVSGHQCVTLTNQVLNEHLCIWEQLPKGVIELLYALQSWFNPLISVQDYVVRIQLKIFDALLRIRKALDRT